MKKLIKEFPNAKYYDEGKKDVLNQKVLTSYFINDVGEEIQNGYMYHRSKSEIKNLKKEYGSNVGIKEFTDCLIDVY